MRKSIYDKDQKVLRELLREIRLSAGLRQEDLAQKLDYAQSFISKYEKGERRIDVIELRQICHAVGVSFGGFMSVLEKSLTPPRYGARLDRKALAWARERRAKYGKKPKRP